MPAPCRSVSPSAGRSLAGDLSNTIMKRGTDRFADLTVDQRRLVADSLELVARRLRGDPEPVTLLVDQLANELSNERDHG